MYKKLIFLTLLLVLVALKPGSALITLDLSSRESYTVSWEGEAGDMLGFVIATGNLNNDSRKDFLIGAPYYNSQTGRLYTFHGKDNSLWSGNLSQDRSGVTEGPPGSMSFASIIIADVNGDGVDESFLGDPKETSGSSQLGKIFITSNEIQRIIWGSSAEALFGAFLNKGDWNQDGKEDVFISAPRYEYPKGAIYIATIESLVNLPAAVSLTEASREAFFARLKGGGATGRWMGAKAGNALGTQSRLVVSIYESSEAIVFDVPGAAGWRIQGPSNSYFGIGTATGDINGDGVGDLVITAPFDENKKGSVFVFFGPENLPSTLTTTSYAALKYLKFIGPAEGRVAGLKVVDINQDGKDDILAAASAFVPIESAPADSVNVEGKVYLILGSSSFQGTGTSSNLEDVAQIKFVGRSSTGILGFGNPGLETADINGDGTQDLLVAEPTSDTNSGKGGLYLISNKKPSKVGINLPPDRVSFEVGEKITITISTTNESPAGIAQANLYFYNGSSWSFLTSEASSTWSYAWTVPSVETSSAKLKAEASTHFGSITSGESSTFTIGPSSSVPTPETSGEIISNVNFSSPTNLSLRSFEVSYNLGQGVLVTIVVSDTLGKVVRVISTSGQSGSNTASWDGLDAAGNPAPSGVYYLTFIINNKKEAEKIFVVTR